MRRDVSSFGELDRAVHDYRGEAMPSEPLILVLHTPGQVVYRFIVNEHAIAKQECTATGDARE